MQMTAHQKNSTPVKIYSRRLFSRDTPPDIPKPQLFDYLSDRSEKSVSPMRERAPLKKWRPACSRKPPIRVHVGTAVRGCPGHYLAEITVTAAMLAISGLSLETFSILTTCPACGDCNPSFRASPSILS